MSTPSDDRIREVVRAIGEASPEPPLLSSSHESPVRDDGAVSRRRVVLTAAASFVSVGVVIAIAALLVRALAPGPAVGSTISVLHQVFEYEQSADVSCPDGELTEAGEFDSMTIEVWADFEGRRFRQQATYPDGSTSDVISLGHPTFPREAYTRGELLGRRVECSTMGLLLSDPTEMLGVLLFNSPIEEPGAQGYAELGTLLAGDNSDSRDRPADVYQEVTEGTSVDSNGVERVLRQVIDWYVAAGDRLLEVRFEQTTDGASDFSRTTTLVLEETETVEESLFDITGYTLTWDESSYSGGTAVEGRVIDPSTRLGPEWIWPETPDPAGPEEVASRFAIEVLAWESATAVADPQADPAGPTMVTIDDGAGRSVSFLTFPSGDGWSAIQIGDSGVSAGVGAEATVRIFVTPPDGATSAIVLVGTVDTTMAWQADLTTGATEILLPGITFNELRTSLVIYSDGDGRTMGAAGGSFGP